MNMSANNGRSSRLFSVWLIFAVILLSVLLNKAWAAEASGSYVHSYGGFLNNDDKREAEDKALQNAVERWISEKNSSHYDNYKRVSDTINEDVRAYLLDYVTTNDQDRSAKTYRVMARVNINEPKLMDILLSVSEANGNAGEQYITFIFVAREQIGTENRSTKEASLVKEQEQTINKEREENSASQGKTQEQTIRKEESGVIFKADPIWDVTTTNEVNAAIGRIFAESDYLVIDAALLEEETNNKLKIDSFIEDYRYGSDLGGQTRRDAIQGLQSLEDPVRYFAIGTLDVDKEVIDPQTGNIKIAVSITSEVLDINRRGAVVARVGPEVMLGEGPTFLVARNNALKLAAEQVAKELVGQLSSRDIR